VRDVIMCEAQWESDRKAASSEHSPRPSESINILAFCQQLTIGNATR
jgi:hypothetical protein